MTPPGLITDPNESSLDSLCEALSQRAARGDGVTDWPAESLTLCGRAGVYRWFLPEHAGGIQWSAEDQTRGYLRLAAADLTTTFVITQFMGAIKRIVSSDNAIVRDQFLQDLVAGRKFATVGISHLTTSRRHLDAPVLLATEVDAGFRFSGLSPWVTGSPHADVYVIGATMKDGREILAAVPRESVGVEPGRGAELIALSASCTDQVRFDDVIVPHDHVLAGPVANVMSVGTGAGTGGLQTSTLAVGLARAAVSFLSEEASRRSDLRSATDELKREVDTLEDILIAADRGKACDASDVRGRANRLVLRTTQAAMTAAKGAGFVQGHPVGRWCQQALFFLVWSCPAPVAQAHLCELAGVSFSN